MTACVCNVALGSWYPKGQARMRASLEQHGYTGAFDLYQTYPPGSPGHDNRPYAFKSHAMRQAAAKGHDTLVWLDASMVAVAPIEPMLAQAQRDGIVAWDSGWAMGQWTHDAALRVYGLTRDVAMTMPLIVGGVLAVHLSHPLGRAVFDRYCALVDHHETLPGPWANKDGALGDARCLGHRHDMPALTVAIHEHNAPFIKDNRWFHYAQTPNHDQSMIVAVGPGGLDHVR